MADPENFTRLLMDKEKARVLGRGGIAVGWRSLVRPLVRVVPVIPGHPRGPGLVQPLESRGVRVPEHEVLLDEPERVLDLALGPGPPVVERLDPDAPGPGSVLRLGVELVRPELQAAIGEDLGREASASERLVDHHEHVDLVWWKNQRPARRRRLWSSFTKTRNRPPRSGKRTLPWMSSCQSAFGSAASNRPIGLMGGRLVRSKWGLTRM